MSRQGHTRQVQLGVKGAVPAVAFRIRHVASPDVFRDRSICELSLVICRGALRRNESRGAHYKPEFPDRNDADRLKTTRAAWTPDGPAFSHGPVDTSLLPPGPRRYDKATPLGVRPAAK